MVPGRERAQITSPPQQCPLRQRPPIFTHTQHLCVYRGVALLRGEGLRAYSVLNRQLIQYHAIPKVTPPQMIDTLAGMKYKYGYHDQVV